MPRATITSQQPEEFDLKSLAGGKVTLKRMSYGEYLARRDIAAKFRIDSQQGSKDFGGEMLMAQKKVAEFEFKCCVVDHNLEDDNGGKMNLTAPGVLDVLDPRVGEEISVLIDNMNQFEAEVKN